MFGSLENSFDLSGVNSVSVLGQVVHAWFEPKFAGLY